MLQCKPVNKVSAFIMLLIFTVNTFAPTVTYALTSGPTVPEATSFEPIDTTDMVNLQTGDFTYNVPLIEVPGPEGGYPLSLSYHAGIQPNEDASWVGLGWTLNPGAITRSVNGFPDDWYAPNNSSHTYWEGGVTKTYNLGVSVGIANCATVGAGLSVSNDTYRGFGLGGHLSLGVGYQLSENAGIGANIKYGISAYGGGTYLSGGVGVNIGGEGGLKTSLGVGFSTNFQSTSMGLSAGVSYSKGGEGSRQWSLLDASMSTGGNKPSLGVGGLTASVSGTKSAAIQTKSSGFNVDIPVYACLSVSLGFNKVRYWTNETTNTVTHGSIYTSGWSSQSDNAVYNDVAYDSYSLLEDPSVVNMFEHADPTQLQGGAFYDFDLYNVTAQGLGGSIRPYLLQGEVLGQNRRTASNNPSVTYYSPGVTSSQPQFRFIGDFSNSYRQNYPNYLNTSLNYRAIEPPYDPNPVYGDNDGDYGYDYVGVAGPKLAGSKHIDLGVKIKPSNLYGYVKSERIDAEGWMIEGFSITNESGVTYHYALPAYVYGEEITQSKIGNENNNFNRQKKSRGYAYTWYLTTITGPDFVDRDGDSKAGANDWGYWVNFEYGKWSNAYNWRNPSEGYNRDEDNEWANCSMGKKEVYYLNAIRTRTHVALFEKELRKDGKGAEDLIFQKNNGNTRGYTYPAGLFGAGSAQSLKLSKIYLVNAEDGNAVIPTGSGSNPYSNYVTPYCTDCQLPQNVLEKSDIELAGRANLENKAIRVIDFETDYSLCPNTTNSFDLYSPEKFGKLTLKQLNFRGKHGQNLLPPTKFEY